MAAEGLAGPQAVGTGPATAPPTTSVAENTSSTTTLPIRNTPTTPSAPPFDIVSTYHSILHDHPDYTQPVAAIQALIELLRNTSSSTVYETLDLLKKNTAILKASQRNPVPLTAGTDLFVQFIVTTLKEQEQEQEKRRPGSSASDGSTATATATTATGTATPGSRFAAMLDHLIRNGDLFAARAIAARDRIAEAGLPFLASGNKTVLTFGDSRAVNTLLAHAATKTKEKRGHVPFRVVYVRDADHDAEGDAAIADLRARGIAVAHVPQSAVAYMLAHRRKIDLVFVGAEAVVHTGGVLSRMGTYQIAELARAAKVPFYVVAETHKFVRHNARDQTDATIGFPQAKDAFDFTTDDKRADLKDPLDYTSHDLITAFVTENGLKYPTYVYQSLSKIYSNFASDELMASVQAEMAELASQGKTFLSGWT